MVVAVLSAFLATTLLARTHPATTHVAPPGAGQGGDGAASAGTPGRRPRVRTNEVAYLPDGPKNATVVTTAPLPLAWRLVDARRAVVAQGRTTPRGTDTSSGQRVHTADFGSFRGHGTGFTLVVGGESSHPFDIAAAPYRRLSLDALKFYYPQRSGIAVRGDLRPGYARPAGHHAGAPGRGDTRVTCAARRCAYRLDVSGGWYDAGDQGKYVVNGGISVWELLHTYERSRHARTGRPQALGDRTLDIPESGNGVPDILDEARWELEFLLRMQVPAGRPLAGMAHHKVHDDRWTPLPLPPQQDTRRRELHPPTTEATLNLAAAAAQGARLYGPYDRAFARRCLAAARTAWRAALAHPDRHADPHDTVGGGAYAGRQAGDEFYWAAAELYLTTGEREFADRVLNSPQHTADVFGPLGFDWARTAGAGRLDLATVPNRLPGRDRIRRSVVRAADTALATLRHQPYGMPYAPPHNAYDWGSNAQILNNAQVVATAYDLTGERRYRDGALESMDYVLGRNALGVSYVTGYGEVAAHNQHSRWYAHQLDPRLPHPPPGTLAGGPNSALQDPVARRRLKGCVGQLCYIDDIQSWSTNELTVNWNAALVWMAAFAAEQGERP